MTTQYDLAQTVITNLIMVLKGGRATLRNKFVLLTFPDRTSELKTEANYYQLAISNEVVADDLSKKLTEVLGRTFTSVNLPEEEGLRHYSRKYLLEIGYLSTDDITKLIEHCAASQVKLTMEEYQSAANELVQAGAHPDQIEPYSRIVRVLRKEDQPKR